MAIFHKSTWVDGEKQSQVGRAWEVVSHGLEFESRKWVTEFGSL